MTGAELLRCGIKPLKPGWIIDAFNVRGAEVLERYALWGGVPRYRELAIDYSVSGVPNHGRYPLKDNIPNKINVFLTLRSD